LGIIFAALDGEQFQAGFIDWEAALKTTLDGGSA